MNEQLLDYLTKEFYYHQRAMLDYREKINALIGGTQGMVELKGVFTPTQTATVVKAEGVPNNGTADVSELKTP